MINQLLHNKFIHLGQFSQQQSIKNKHVNQLNASINMERRGASLTTQQSAVVEMLLLICCAILFSLVCNVKHKTKHYYYGVICASSVTLQVLNAHNYYLLHCSTKSVNCCVLVWLMYHVKILFLPICCIIQLHQQLIISHNTSYTTS